MSTIHAAVPPVSSAERGTAHPAAPALAALLATIRTTLTTSRTELRERAARRSFQRTLQLAPPNIQREILAAAAHRASFR